MRISPLSVIASIVCSPIYEISVAMILILYFALLLSLLLSLSSAVDIQFEISYYAPFLSYGGYASEALSMVHAFDKWIERIVGTSPSPYGFSYNASVSLYQHGDTPSRPLQATSFVEKDLVVLRKYMTHQNRLSSQSTNADGLTINVVICHSEPGAWSAPHPHYMTMNACPPSDNMHRLQRKSNKGSNGSKKIVHKVGRTMFETDRIPDGWQDRLNYMDEIFIPSEFFQETFLRTSDDKDALAKKLTIVGEPVDTEFFTPSPASLSVLQEIHSRLEQAVSSSRTVFLFVGKWETRKAIDVLVSAFVNAFPGDTADMEKPLLVLLTNAYYSSSDFDSLVRKHLHSHFQASILSSADSVDSAIDDIMSNSILILTKLPQKYLPMLYSHITTLVQPSRGEGWGRPLVEVMACGVPVITTNWSGQLAYANHENSYLLESEGLVPAEGWPGHYWAQPSQSHLVQLLRHIHHKHVEADEELIAKGRQAREDMVKHYSYEQFSYVLQKRIESIGAKYYQEQWREEL